MKFRKLGSSTLSISEISLGCMSLPPSVSEARNVMEIALDAGINYFDTADLYDRGLNEQIVGEIVHPYRENIILATKVGNRVTEGVDGWHWDASPSYIKNAVKMSLQRLQTDYIDVYQLHGGTIEDNLEAVIDTFDELKKEGLIRAYGISSIRPNVFVPFLQNSHAVSNMMQYNMLDRCAEEYFGVIEANGASVVTRGSIAKGLLTEQWRTRLNNYMNYSSEELQQVLPKLEEMYGSLHSAALAFNLQHPVVASTVIGARTKEQLTTNLQAYDHITSLSSLQRMNELLKVDCYQNHR